MRVEKDNRPRLIKRNPPPRETPKPQSEPPEPFIGPRMKNARERPIIGKKTETAPSTLRAVGHRRQKGGEIGTDPTARVGEPSPEVLARQAGFEKMIEDRQAQGFSGMKVKGYR